MKQALIQYKVRLKMLRKVYIGESGVFPPYSGRGLFAGEYFPCGATITFYSGWLIGGADAQYMDPTYIVEWEITKSGLKLVGDDHDGYFGHFINSVNPASCDHPSYNNNIHVNARYCLNERKVCPCGRRGMFKIKTIEEVPENGEFVVDYGSSHWSTVARWHSEDLRPVPSPQAVERNKRYHARCGPVEMLKSCECFKGKQM